MKVIFVIQGEGRGHLTQALALKQMMEREGHEVVKMLVGKSKMRELPSFFVNQAGCPMEQFYSPNFLPAKDNCRCGLLRSIAYNICLTPTYLSSILYIRNQVRKSGAELVVNFYELLCGLTYAMFHFGIPEVCVGHQYLFLHPSFKMPQRHTLSGAMLKLFTRFTCLRATRTLALSLRNYDKKPVAGMKVVPPLLRSEVKHAVRHHGNYIVGYILNAGFADEVKRWHEQHPATHLHFFWDKADAPAELAVDDTLTFHRLDDAKFPTLLAGCKAYATAAGFESVCEALYMGKPCMMIPAHVEQECNAADAERELVGFQSESFDIDRLQAFARGYEEDVEFRMWENSADARIMAAIDSACNEYRYMGEDAYGDASNTGLVFECS